MGRDHARIGRMKLAGQAFALEKGVNLIDPLGNLMLRFPPDADPRQMINDLARLLKYSRSG